ncbi:MAG: peptidylprolyl isomerase [Planctomycetia bacterium]|nr:peptidylprolyl isomerase [Planctomycetia bacterium]
MSLSIALRLRRPHAIVLACQLCAVAGFLFSSSSFYAEEPNDVTLTGARVVTAPANVPTATTRTYYDGAETLGRVGHEAILKRDVLHNIKKQAHLQYLEELKKIPEEDREAYSAEYKEKILEYFLNSSELYTQALDAHIRHLLFYNDYVISCPKEQVQEQTKQLEKEFDSKYIPELLTQFNCKNVKELEEYFEKEIKSNLAQEKRIFLQYTFGILWMNHNLGEEEFSPTLTDLRRYYEANLDEFRVTPRVRWQAMTVYYGAQRSRDDAQRKIVHMGNAVQGAPVKEQERLFAEVCRVDSEDSFASKGGYRDWTVKGTLRSAKVEEAIFSEELPVGVLSKIIEDNGSFTIVRIVARESERIKTFTEVQEEVREKLIADRTEAMKKKYEERLSERFSIEIYALSPEEREQCFHTADREELSASGRKTRY